MLAATHRSILGCMAAFGAAAGCFPVWQTCVCMSDVLSPWPQAAAFGCLFLCGLLTLFSMQHWKRSISAAFSGLLGLAAGAVLWQIGCRFSAVFLPLLTVFVMQIRGKLDAPQLFGSSAFAAFLSLETVTLLLLSWTMPHAALIPWGVGVTAGESVIFLYLRNQFHLLRLVSRRSDVLQAVPDDIRRGNLLLLTGLVGIAALALLLKKQIIQLLSWCKIGLIWLLRLIFQGLKAFVSLMQSADEAVEGEGGGAQMPTQSGTENPLWNLLFIIVIPILLYMAYLLFRALYFGIRSLISYLKTMHFHENSVNGVRRSTEDYVDVETDCRREKTGSAQRTWRRAYRAWCRQPDSDEKFYAGYHLLETAPNWAGEHPVPADTIAQIDTKWGNSMESAAGCSLSAVTKSYHENRFGGGARQADAMDALQAALKAISRQKSRKDKKIHATEL